MQILNVLTSKNPLKMGWRFHPAVKMWAGYELALASYMNICIREWEDRGYRNNMNLYRLGEVQHLIEWPPWMGNEIFHESHQSNLLRKDYDYYSHFFPDMPDDLPYYWPV